MLQAETAALTSLQTKHEGMVAALSSNLDDSEEALADLRSELRRVTEEAASTKASLSQQISDAETKIARLETSLAETRSKAEEDLKAAAAEAEATLSQQRELLTSLSVLGGRQTERGMLLSLAETELRFRTASADLPAEELPSLDSIAELLVEYPQLSARIEGHTDSSGRNETNLQLSQQRADAVRAALIKRGVAEDRLVAEGIGETRPIADNGTAAGRRQNRRVDVYVIENL
jgi:outer membrane protein OmpA-like peptidoglycan-associated protein